MSLTAFYMLETILLHLLLSVPSQTKLIYVEENLPLPGLVSPPGAPWPWPLIWQSEAQQVTLDPSNFTIIANLKGCDVIDAALHRYEQLTLIDRKVEPDQGLPVLPHLHVSISGSCDKLPRLNQDKNYESYSLIVEMNNGSAVANLNAVTVWGALRGLETFSQLVYIQEPMNVYRLNLTKVEDEPRFPHRGLLLDTARHFLPKHVLLQVLDSMTWNKLNVFHWHIVDDQSFPYESLLFKNLTEFGAYTRRHVYTQKDVNDIVEYARLRGIRVIPEFDTPGHAQGFGKAFPHLLTPCYGDGRTPGTPNYPYHAAYENLDPTNNGVYEFMRSFLVDVKTTFKDYIHLGLDEVFLPCWAGSPVVRKFMTEHNYTEVREVEQHYVKEILRLAKDTPMKSITWQDPAERGIQMENDSLVQIWKDVSLSPTKMKGWREYVQALTEKGYKVILSSCWYINFITYGQDWKNFYNCDPTSFAGTPAQKQLVLGGEAAMWGEYVDATNLMPRLWPRASAAAERLWSMPLDQAPSADDAASRLDQHRCRMLRRGIPAQPILNGFCGEWEVPHPDEVPQMSTKPPPTFTPPPPTLPTMPSTKAPVSTTQQPIVVENTIEEDASNLVNMSEHSETDEPKKLPLIAEHPVVAKENNTIETDQSTDIEVSIPADEMIEKPSESFSVPPPVPEVNSSTQTSVPTTTEGIIIEEIDETENNVDPKSDIAISEAPVSESDSSVKDDSVSAAPIESVEKLSAAVKYIESKIESNDVEEQMIDSAVST